MKRTILVLSLFTSQMIFTPAFAAVGGSYIRTCNNIIDDGVYLIATCGDKQGNPRRSRLNYKKCLFKDAVFNNDGKLKCIRRRS